MKEGYVYLYGMVLATNSFLLEGGFLKPDEYSEIKARFRLPGGETGTCATVLASLGEQVVMSGTHIGKNVSPVIREFYADKSVELSSLFFDDSYEGLEDYVIIADSVRSPMGTFSKYFSCGEKRWSTPAEQDIVGCAVAGIDPFFGEGSELAARLCARLNKPYATIDCKYDSFLHRHSAVSVISGEGLLAYPGMTREELFPLFRDNGGGLTIITNGAKGVMYGRRGEELKTLEPFKVDVVSTLGAGDTFKAGCVYGLLHGMNDDELVRFASACSAVAITRFPLPLDPPKLDEVNELLER